MENQEAAEEVQAWRYGPSWFDRLTAWLERRPGPSSVYYALLGAALFLVLMASAAARGNADSWITDPMRVYAALIAPYVMAVAHFLDRTAALAIDKLRPSLELDRVSFERLRYQISTMPAGPTTLASIIAIVTVHVPLLFGSKYVGIDLDLSQPSQLVFGVVGIGIWWVAGMVVYHTIHQLRMVNLIYTQYTNVNLYRLGPLYSLSTVTALTAVAIVLPVSIAVALLPSLALRPLGLSVVVVSLLLAGIAFAWPLWGVHRIMLDEKQRLEIESSKRYEALIEDLHLKVDNRQLEGSGDLHSVLRSLLTEKAEIKKIPTWPWTPGRLRGGIAALFLPISVWILQWLLERFVLGN